MKPILLLALFVTVLYGLGSSLLPLIVAGIAALLCEPYIVWMRTKGIKKPYSTILLIIGLFLPIILLNALIIPKVLSEAKEFLTELPDNITKLLDQLENWAVTVGLSLDYSRADVMDLINTHTKELSVNVVTLLTDALKRSAGNITQVLLTVMNVFLIPIFFFYLVSEKNYWRASIKALISKDHHDKISKTLDNSVAIIKSYLQGQVLACAVLALLYGVGLQLTGLRFGILIGLITGILSFIPYAGFSLGLAMGVIVAFSMGKGFSYVGLVVLVFMIVQTLESFVVSPKLVGNTVGLTALESILVLIIFGNLFGFVGMLVAIPTGAVIKTVLTEYATA